jgi:hypothetical protein
VRKAFARVLTAAKLPNHFHPHCLRHTFASLLLQQGESPAYVQRQLGHARIQLTVDTCGKWLPMGNKAVVYRRDVWPSATVETPEKEANGSGVVADRTSELFVNPQLVEMDGGPHRTRTCGPLIKSQLLYQLS